MAKRTVLPLYEIALFGVLGALTFGAKFVMSGLPNIEPVSLMVMLFAAVFGWKALYPIYLYVMLEILVYGINLWNINYLYVWTVLAMAAMAIRKVQHPLCWALLSGAFGLAFGFLCSPVYMVLDSFSYAIRWWQAGLPFDAIHGIGNFVMALVLFVPLRRLLTALYTRTEQTKTPRPE